MANRVICSLKFLVAFSVFFGIVIFGTILPVSFQAGSLQQGFGPGAISVVWADTSDDDQPIFLPMYLSFAQTVNPFPQDVAVGDVTSSSAVLWTRAPGASVVSVQWSRNPTFSGVIDATIVPVSESDDYTAHINLNAFNADTLYYYRWKLGSKYSRVGQFRTAPAMGENGSLRLAFSGDSDGTLDGAKPAYNYFEVLEAARHDQPDFFVYLGDTIYSDSPFRPGGPAITLDTYRAAYKLNRKYQALRDLLAGSASVVIWDDHEVYNDYDGETVDGDRYEAGRQAFLEYMPQQQVSLPQDDGCAGPPLFRVLHWGAMADLFVLDERSCRSASAIDVCTLPGETVPDLAPALDPILRALAGLPPTPPPGCSATLADADRTFLGASQLQAFKDALQASSATYKIIVNELPIQQFFVLPYDRWEGYEAERNDVLQFLQDNEIENVLFLTTDIHANVMNEVFSSDGVPVGYESIVGPIAAHTFEQTVRDLAGQQGVDLVNTLFDALDVDCRHLDKYAYGLLEIDAGTGAATLTIKDEEGNVIVDQSNASRTCEITINP